MKKNLRFPISLKGFLKFQPPPFPGHEHPYLGQAKTYAKLDCGASMSIYNCLVLVNIFSFKNIHGPD